MPELYDGPSTSKFRPVQLAGGLPLAETLGTETSAEMAAAWQYAPSGRCVCWGIPFDVSCVYLIQNHPASIPVQPVTAGWLVFMHTTDLRKPQAELGKFLSPYRGEGHLGERAATYVVKYEDGRETRLPVIRRIQVGAFQRGWGENCFEAVASHKPFPVRAAHEQIAHEWWVSQTRCIAADEGPWVTWLWAWENPYPRLAITAFELEPCNDTVLLLAISAGNASAHPLRWRPRRKAALHLPPGTSFAPDLNEHGLLRQVQLDLGQVISAAPRLIYPDQVWSETHDNQLPEVSPDQLIIEYTAHPDACFHLPDGRKILAAAVEGKKPAASGVLVTVPPAKHWVTLRVIEADSKKVTPVRLHVHGEWGEYIPPVDRHRMINPAWFEDYSVDFIHRRLHSCSYIPGETRLLLPCSKVYIEASKGFEIQPVRIVREVTPQTNEIVIEVRKVLGWREKGWVTADTHVHFLSPISALLEGAAEGVNVVNLLATQLGEMLTNVGDFDGRTTWGSPEAGGEGEYVVRVGTENRQHVLGHISLLGYAGPAILPLATGGPDESAMGDPVAFLLTEWAQQCREQGGLVVFPHFPNPRAESAAAIVNGAVDAIEMTSWGEFYNGINPYSLVDWYRFLNCGYLVAAVGGTDKMSAEMAVGTVRTYAHLHEDQEFTYTHWMDAIRRAETFVTYGPLIEFAVDGKPMGSQLRLAGTGGTVEVWWQAASVTIPLTRVELVVNGEIRESQSVTTQTCQGTWRVPIRKSSWLALLVRGNYSEKPEVITAHSSPVMVWVEGSPMLAAADAVTILEQIEGVQAFLETVGTRPEKRAYKRMRLVLESAHRSLHNRLHQQGMYHQHTTAGRHAGHDDL